MIEHTIYKEFIDKISELSDGIYPIITDLITTYHTYLKRQQIFSALKPASIPASLNSLALVSTTLTSLNISRKSAIV